MLARRGDMAGWAGEVGQEIGISKDGYVHSERRSGLAGEREGLVDSISGVRVSQVFRGDKRGGKM